MLGAPEQEPVTLPAGQALRLTYEQEIGSGPQLAILQYLLFENETGYVISYTTLPDRLAEYAETFEASAQSFGFLEVDELDQDRALEGARLLAAAKELGDGLAPLLAVVLGQLVHVHADELVGELGGEAPPVLEGVLEGLFAVGKPGPNRVSQDVAQLRQDVVAEVASRDVDPEGQR